ncbi:HmuY family protein [Corallococcus macrosporus]|uniref:HmuY family protein n=1 Tax=Corallococcus macrosporus TaxID=35 RepID=A0ABS3DA74_9BACT|nr:HmuY family protein [Corallococcus macrosporus]MBN8228560.1 HmuY family protein [Corallococcus macrosporus]
MFPIPFRPGFLGRACAALLLAGLGTACGDDLQPTPGPEDDDPLVTPQDGANLKHQDNGDGSFTSVVDATDGALWVAVDLDSGKQVSAADDALWDLSFQRYTVKTRGGVSGTGGVQVAIVPGTSFAALTQAPASGYLTDAADGPDTGDSPDTVFNAGDGWYSYDLQSHTLMPRAQLYVVRSDAGTYFKVQMQSYYDTAGTPAMVKLLWAKVAAPAGGQP